MKWILFSLLSPFLFAELVEALCVNVEKANLRAGPSTNTRKTWEVYRYMPFELVKTQSGWHQVKDVDGDLHWIFGRLVSRDLNCAVVKVRQANLRNGPGTNHRAVPWSPVQKYYAFKIIGRQGSWIQVEDAASGKAWVHRDLVWTPGASPAASVAGSQ
ncbi:MAG: hypothetical protein EA369_06720 [Bradymonadales bacterium]|nr:MAG: hypothetical protein EA369_06720 [Bradymonadales bacterium]